MNVCCDIGIIDSGTFFERCCDVLQDYWFIVASVNQLCNWKSYSERRTERLMLPLFCAIMNINECGILWPIPIDAQLQIKSSVRNTLPNILWSRYWNVIICRRCTRDIDCETHSRFIITPLSLLFCGPIRWYRLSKAHTYKRHFVFSHLQWSAYISERNIAILNCVTCLPCFCFCRSAIKTRKNPLLKTETLSLNDSRECLFEMTS